ncbi:MAG: hypothetical protein Q8K75_03025 [Chlamydiales bacterium]|nr:hypothetical protein [Chlamydiales bacterium]
MWATIGAGLSAASSIVTLRGAIGASSGSDKYTDYFATLWKLAELNFCPPGTKLIFKGHHITFSYPGIGQAAQRSVANATTGGAHAVDLVNLLPGIYYGLKALDPYKNPCTRLFCLLAWRGTLLLQSTYRGEGDFATAQLLQRHVSLFEKFFKGKTVNPADYDIPDLSNHTLKILSDNYWMEKGRFAGLHKGMMDAIDASVKRQNVYTTVSSFTRAKTTLKDLAATITDVVAKVGSNIAAPAKVELPEILLSPEEFDKQLTSHISWNLWSWIQNPLFQQASSSAEIAPGFQQPTIIDRLRRLGIQMDASMPLDIGTQTLMTWINPPPQIDAVPPQTQGSGSLPPAPKVPVDPGQNSKFVPPHVFTHQNRSQQREQGTVGSIPQSYNPRQLKSPEVRGILPQSTQHSAPSSTSIWSQVPPQPNPTFQMNIPPPTDSYTSYYTYEYPEETSQQSNGWNTTAPSIDIQETNPAVQPIGQRGSSKKEDDDGVLFAFDDDEFNLTAVTGEVSQFDFSDEDSDEGKKKR